MSSVIGFALILSNIRAPSPSLKNWGDVWGEVCRDYSNWLSQQLLGLRRTKKEMKNISPEQAVCDCFFLLSQSLGFPSLGCFEADGAVYFADLDFPSPGRAHSHPAPKCQVGGQDMRCEVNWRALLQLRTSGDYCEGTRKEQTWQTNSGGRALSISK